MLVHEVLEYKPNYIEYSNINLFPDDTALFLTGSSEAEIESKSNSDLSSISQYLEANKLVINTAKSEFMFFGTPQKLAHVRPLEIYFRCYPMKQVDSTKYLGVTLDKYLSWTPHVDNLCKNISSRIGILKRIRPFLDNVSSNLIYSNTILPLFDYCDVVWDTCTINSKNKLQRLQNRAARIIQKSSNLINVIGYPYGTIELVQT